MKIEVYTPTEDVKAEEVVHTLRLEKTKSCIELQVVDPITGLRLGSGTLMRFYPNGRVKFKRANGCRQGGYENGTIEELV